MITSTIPNTPKLDNLMSRNATPWNHNRNRLLVLQVSSALGSSLKKLGRSLYLNATLGHNAGNNPNLYTTLAAPHYICYV